MWFTVWQALASTALTIAVALPAAYVLGRYRFRGRSVVSALVVVPFVLPTVVVALAFLAILPDGAERGWAPILVAHAFFNVAVVVRIVGTFWASLDPRLGEAAATLGAAPLARFRTVTAPLLAPALAAAAAIVFLFSFTSFGVVLILGGPRYATIEAEIYNQAVRLFDLRAAAVLFIVQFACVVAAVVGRGAARAATRVGAASSDPKARRFAGPAPPGTSSSWERASAGSLSSSGCRSPSSSSARSQSGTATGLLRTRRSGGRRAWASQHRGRPS